ncbi:hypothetical protein WJX74_001762 [Apatococcus lobatus]|uniref:Uncharacterized protein n=1 Tax=Apatococcus lobatus TaxID=904363 RepID=A0AAW1QDG8_9CHLO
MICQRRAFFGYCEQALAGTEDQGKKVHTASVRATIGLLMRNSHIASGETSRERDQWVWDIASGGRAVTIA